MFPGHTIVLVKEKGFVKMSELSIGDKVQVADDTFEPVYGFGHKNQRDQAEFLRIHSSKFSDPIELSAIHMVYVKSKVTGWMTPVAASKVRVGDHLLSPDGPNEVTQIEVVQAQGLYAPFTKSGKLYVNNILVSAFIDVFNVDHVAWDTIGGSHYVVYATQSLHRLYCRLFATECRQETYSDYGYSNFTHKYLRVLDWWESLNIFWRALVVLLLIPPYLFLNFLELSLETLGWPMVALVVVMVAFTLKARKKNNTYSNLPTRKDD